MSGLQKSVGTGQPNLPADVRLVTEWLSWWVVALNHLPFTRLEDGIRWFQSEVMGDPFPTGIVTPESTTASNLQQRPSLAPAVFPRRPPTGVPLRWVQPGTPLALPPRMGMDPLSDDDYAAAAKRLGCEVLAIKAVAMQEGQGRGFDESNRPIILYEPDMYLQAHVRQLQKREQPAYRQQFRTDYPALTRLKPAPHPYGDLSSNWQFLQWAYLLDPQEALRDVSWGQFQILGSNSLAAGYGTPEDFVNAMCRSLQDQLQAFAVFILANNTEDALAKKDWATFARVYNGPKYYVKHYDRLIKEQYDKLATLTGD